MMFVGDNKVSITICLNCHRRWIAARHIGVRLEELECPDCHNIGCAIETGEIFEATDFLTAIAEKQGWKQ